jgi:sporulation protein YlmC with PRC-barrel domain
MAPAANDSTAMAPAGGAATTAPATNDTAMAPADGDAASTDTAAAPAGSSTTGNNANSDTAAAPATGDAATTDTAAAPAANDNAATDTTQTGAIDKSTLKQTASADIRAEELVGTTVYGANDEDVGEIGDVILSQDGKVDSVIVDVGGFLGMGEKEVAVGLDNISFMTDADGNNYLYTNFTKEQLESQAEYDESTWAEQRDQQRMMIQ